MRFFTGSYLSRSGGTGSILAFPASGLPESVFVSPTRFGKAPASAQSITPSRPNKARSEDATALQRD